MQPRNISLGDKDSSVHSSCSSAFAVAQSTTCSWSLSSEGFISAVMRWHGFCQDREHAELLYLWHLAPWTAGVLCEHSLARIRMLVLPREKELALRQLGLLWTCAVVCRVLLLCSDFPRRWQGHSTVCLGFVEPLLSKGALITGYQSEQRSPGSPVTPGTKPGGCARHFRKNIQVFLNVDQRIFLSPPTHPFHKTPLRAVWKGNYIYQQSDGWTWADQPSQFWDVTAQVQHMPSMVIPASLPSPTPQPPALGSPCLPGLQLPIEQLSVTAKNKPHLQRACSLSLRFVISFA